MKNSLFIAILFFGCSTKQETNVTGIHSDRIDSLNSINNQQTEKIHKTYQNKIDSLKYIISQEKLRTASDLNLFDFENYIKIHCGIPEDSIRILGAERYESSADRHVITFIDYNSNSIFHDRLIKGYRFAYNKEKSAFSLNSDLKNGHWVTIKKYNKYNYAFYFKMGEFMQRGFTISDSNLVTYNNMEESDGTISKINSISSFDDMININKGQIILTQSDNPEIYVCNERGIKSFIVHESNLNKYPIIVQDGHELGTTSHVRFIEPK